MTKSELLALADECERTTKMTSILFWDCLRAALPKLLEDGDLSGNSSLAEFCRFANAGAWLDAAKSLRAQIAPGWDNMLLDIQSDRATASLRKTGSALTVRSNWCADECLARVAASLRAAAAMMEG